MLNNSDNLLTIKQAAAVLCVAPTTLYQWASAGRVPHVRLGRCIRFQVAQLIDFIRNNTVSENQPTSKTPTPRQNRKEKRQTNKIINNKYLDDLLEHAKNDVLNKN